MTTPRPQDDQAIRRELGMRLIEQINEIIPDIELIDALVTHGADLTVTDADKSDALMLAAYFDMASTVEMLIAAGAALTGRDKAGHTALMRASSVKVAKLLLDAGADSRAESTGGTRALTFFTKISQPIALLELIIAHDRAALDHQNAAGLTALTAATFFGNLPAMECLLAAGADPTLASGSDTAVARQAGKTPLKYIEENLDSFTTAHGEARVTAFIKKLKSVEKTFRQRDVKNALLQTTPERQQQKPRLRMNRKHAP